ncbi:hypothetical protein ElyMa_004525700, partial [Elysia marginata]
MGDDCGDSIYMSLLKYPRRSETMHMPPITLALNLFRELYEEVDWEASNEETAMIELTMQRFKRIHNSINLGERRGSVAWIADMFDYLSQVVDFSEYNMHPVKYAMDSFDTPRGDKILFMRDFELTSYRDIDYRHPYEGTVLDANGRVKVELIANKLEGPLPPTDVQQRHYYIQLSPDREEEATLALSKIISKIGRRSYGGPRCPVGAWEAMYDEDDCAALECPKKINADSLDMVYEDAAEERTRRCFESCSRFAQRIFVSNLGSVEGEDVAETMKDCLEST